MLARAQRLALPGVIALAGFLRLFYLQYGQYGSDDERLWAQALRALAAHQLPTSGIRSSIGANNGPFQVYLVMPVAAVFAETPIAGAIIVGLLNAAAVYFLYRFVAEFFGQRPALAAAALFAVNSWAVIYSRRMQGQDMLVPFQVLFFWSAARWLARGRGLDLVLTFLWLAILTQVYVLGLLHLATMGVVLALGWRHLHARTVAGGALVFGLFSVRYWRADLAPALGSFGNVTGASPRIDGQSIELALTMATHKGFQTIAGQAGAVLDATSGLEGVLVWAEEALFAAGLAYGVVRLGQQLRPGSDRKQCPLVLGLLVLWALIPMAAFARHSVDLYPYYFVSVLPLPAVFTGLLLDWLWSRGGAPALVVLCANALALAGVFFAVMPGYWTKNDYGLPYRYTFEVAGKVRQMAAERQLGRIYVDGNMDPSEVMSSVLSRAGLDVFWFDDYRTPEFAAPSPGERPPLYVTMADTTDTSRFLRERFAGQQTLAFPLPGEGVTIRGYEPRADSVRQALASVLTERLDARVANGTILEAFGGERRLQPGGRLRAAVSWTWPGGARPDKLRYAIFGHLVGGDGEVLAETDHPLLPSVDWRAGELVVQWLNLPVPANAPPGRYVLDVGIYAQDATTRQELTASDGKSLGSSLALGPFVVPSPPAEAPAGAPEISFADGIDLLVHGASGTAGELQLDLIWGARAQPSKDYTVFVHLLDSSGRLVAQADSQPRGGAFPTSLWRPGDRIADRHTLRAPPGHYSVEAGLYDLATLQRLEGGPLRFDADITG